MAEVTLILSRIEEGEPGLAAKRLPQAPDELRKPASLRGAPP